MNVPLLDLTRSLPEIESELLSACQRIVKSGHYIMGQDVAALEEECAAYTQASYALGVSSGTDALILALMALDIGPGDEVICPTYSFFATSGAVWRVGATPVFVDNHSDTYNCDVEDIRAKITPRTKAIIPVHLYGQCAEMQALSELATQHSIAVIEDAAQAIGAEYKNKRAGSLGTIGCFSFFPTKNLGAFGDAGLVTTNSPELAEKMRVLRVHGGKPKYYHSMVGGNFRIDTLQAALLRIKLRHLEKYTRQRQRNAALYTELLAGQSDAITLPKVDAHCRHTYNQFVVRFASSIDRDTVRLKLADKNIGTEVYYPVPLHEQECFAKLGHRSGDFPRAEAAAKSTLALPIFPELRPEEIEYVATELLKVVREC